MIYYYLEISFIFDMVFYISAWIAPLTAGVASGDLFWGRPGLWRYIMRHIDKIIIHCSATPPDRHIGADEIRLWHIRDKGWTDIGYHSVIRRDGAVEAGRGLELPGAHTQATTAAV